MMSYLYCLTTSARNEKESISTRLAVEYSKSKAQKLGLELHQRQLDDQLPLLNKDLVASYFTPPEDRSGEQKIVLKTSDLLLNELKNSGYLVIASPMYNFSMPGSLKAWSDLVARVGVSFKYTEKGPLGLLQDRPVDFILVSGGVEFGSATDHLSPWLKTFLGFLGITQQRFFTFSQANEDNFKNYQARLKEQL